MTNLPRPVIWLGDSRKNIRAFPKKVQQEIGGAIFIVQCHEPAVKRSAF